MTKFKRLLALFSILILALTGACSAGITVDVSSTPPVTSATATATASAVTSSTATTSTSTSVPGTPPGIYDVEVTVKESSAAINVEVLVRTVQRSDSALGHLIYYFDEDPPVQQGSAAYTAQGTYFVKSALDEPVIWEDVPSGMHIFSAQLVNAADDTPFVEPVIAVCNMYVPEKGTKSPYITRMTVIANFPSPSSLSPTPEPATPVQVQVTAETKNIDMDDDHIGKPDVAGQGHFIYYLDVEPPTAAGRPATLNEDLFKSSSNEFEIWSLLNAGEHTFSVQIVNNDDTPLETPVTGQIILTFPPVL